LNGEASQRSRSSRQPDQTRCQFDLAPAGLGLEWAEGPISGQLLLDTEDPGIHVDIPPQAAQRLADPHAGEGDQLEQRPVAASVVEHLGEVLARQRGDPAWQGVEMSRHDEFTLAAGVSVYFCERASPWQRGTNENTNGLLRQYFPKGTDLRVHTAAELTRTAAELNSRPRKILGWETPSQQLDRLLASGP
jgi:hypothetical protein